MTILFYIIISLLLVIIRTTLIPILPAFEKFYDLLIPIIIFLGFFRPKREGIPVVLFFGFIMDSLCGGPMGLYLTVYVWLYIAVRWTARILSSGNVLILTLAVVVGVVFEIAVLLGNMALLEPQFRIPDDAVKTIVLQLIWAMVTAPLIMVMIGGAQKRLDMWRRRIIIDW